MQRKKIRNYSIERKDSTDEKKFIEQIEKLSENLFYISETDAGLTPFTGTAAEAVTKQEILRQTGKSEDTQVEERDFSELFARLTQLEDWFGDEELETAQKFTKLKDFLQKNLKDLKVFKIGQIELDIYIVGLDAQGKLKGVQTKAVET